MKKKERIYIENFAGIAKLDLEINSINILIGPQGVGKSVVVKLLYFFKEILNEIILTSDFIKSEDYVKLFLRSSFQEIFDESAWKTEKKFRITYISEEGEEFIVKGGGSERENFDIEFPQRFKELLNGIYELKEKFGEIDLINNEIEDYLNKRDSFKRILENFVFKVHGYKNTSQIFIPAGRSFFSTVHSNIYSFINNDENNSIDYFLKKFGRLYQGLSKWESRIDTRSESCDSIIEDIIGGVFVRDENKKDFILHKDKRKVELRNTSSGQQEALPLIIILKAILEKRFHSKGCTLYIEEPEAHLFPTAQNSIVDLLSKVYNSNPKNIQIFITTHSPYILTSFNNLIYAGNVARINESKKLKVTKLISEDRMLNYDIVNANAITGVENVNLMDDENRIINASLLDKVSNTIGEQFDDLLDIEFESNEL